MVLIGKYLVIVLNRVENQCLSYVDENGKPRPVRPGKWLF